MDKINELVNQLQEECEKNNVHLLVSVTFENGLCHVASCGSGAGAYINFMNIKKATAKAMPNHLAIVKPVNLQETSLAYVVNGKHPRNHISML